MSEPIPDYPPPPIETAGAWRRLLARIIDGIVLLIPILVLSYVRGDAFNIGTENDTSSELVTTAIGLLMVFGYFVLMESIEGATLGKMAMGVGLHGHGGRPPTTGQSAMRNAWILVSVVPGTVGGLLSLGLGIAIGITIGVNDQRQGIHDRWARLVPYRR